MAEKPKKKTAKPKGEAPGVMGSLSAQRPARIATGRKPRAKAATAPKSTATTAASAAAAESATPAPKAPAKPRAAAKPRATATRRKAAAPRTFEPTPAAEAAAGPGADLPPTRPRAVREGAPGIGTTPPRDDAAAPESGSGRPSAPELVTGAVKAAGQVAQIGIAIGGELLKKATERLPKP